MIPTSYQRILFCTDFSENADFAFDFALDAARRRPGSTLYLLHVIPESEAQFWRTYVYEVEDVDQRARNTIDEKIDSTYRPRVPAEIDFRPEFRTGRDYDQILQFAGDNDIDLIVMGRQGRSALRKTLFGNVTEKVARKAPCAILIVPLSYEQKLRDQEEPHTNTD